MQKGWKNHTLQHIYNSTFCPISHQYLEVNPQSNDIRGLDNTSKGLLKVCYKIYLFQIPNKKRFLLYINNEDDFYKFIPKYFQVFFK